MDEKLIIYFTWPYRIFLVVLVSYVHVATLLHECPTFLSKEHLHSCSVQLPWIRVSRQTDCCQDRLNSAFPSEPRVFAIPCGLASVAFPVQGYKFTHLLHSRHHRLP